MKGFNGVNYSIRISYTHKVKKISKKCTSGTYAYKKKKTIYIFNNDHEQVASEDV